MLKSKLFKKCGRIAATMLVAIMLIASFVPGAFALNYNGDGSGSGNKPINFNGYEYVDSTNLKIFFSKQSSTTDEINSTQFTVTKVSDSSTPSFSYAESSGTNKSGVSDLSLNKGCTVTLTFDSALSADALYLVTIKAATLADDNLITLGNYRNRNDLKFYFRTPVSGTTWSDTNALVVSYSFDLDPTDASYSASNVPPEPNLAVIFDRPLASGSVTSFLESLSDNFTRGGNEVVQDTVIDTNSVTGAECYYPYANTARNTFFFPETVQGNTYTCYNRAYDNVNHTVYNYSLTLPSSFNDGTTNWDTTSWSNKTFTFGSLGYDVVGWLDNRPAASYDEDEEIVTVTWNQSAITPVATQFDVYYTKGNKFSGTYSQVINPTISGTYTATFAPPAGTGDYYVRVVPKDANTSAGYSVSPVSALTIE